MSGHLMAGNTVKSFACPACGGIVEIRALGHSISAVCEHCSSVIDTANDAFKLIKKEHESNRNTDIPIGAKGVLDTIKWEVIGYVEKKDKSTLSYWEEYLLFNPYFGFRFLIQSDGHWSLAGIIKRYQPLNFSPSEIEYNQRKFSVFCRGTYSVDYVKGEFYWRVRKGEEGKYVDYIDPPYLFSTEKNTQEISQSLAEYIEPEVIAQAFGVELPKKTGVAPNQPPPFFGQLASILMTSGIAILAALFVQLSMSGGNLVQTSSINVNQSDKDKTFSTTVFNLPKRANLLITSKVPVNNSWMELDLALVNEVGNETKFAKQVLEYYHGIDEGDFWSEGGQFAETTFSAVESGNYRIVIDPSTAELGASGIDIQIEVKRNVPVWGNFWFILLGLILLPIYALLYRWNFENNRWENSDYAPVIFQSGESDD
jgi:hypothetical protein